jgi:myo-inositol-1-phosphate synthase
VERPSERGFLTADALLGAIAAGDAEVSPSHLYAAAAALEGCSFVNGGSQNTLCAGLGELAARRGAYVLGTDFKAGQTKVSGFALVGI